MDPWTPINGITLERYAELSASMAGETDREKQALLAGQQGVQRPDWEAASAGWQARMADPALMGQVAQRYWPLYNAAVARRQAPGGLHGPQGAPGYPAPYPQQPSYNAQAQDLGSQMGNALNSFGNALGSFVDGAVGAFAVGSRVMVQWSDGNRYPATVSQPIMNGQLEVAFPDGRRIWVPQGVVSAIY